MREIHYNKSSIFGQAIGCLFLAGGSIWVYLNFEHWQVRLFCALMAVSMPFLSLALFRRGLGSGIAFAYDSRNLVVTSLFSEASIPWQQVQTIHRESLQRSSAFGLIKQDVSREIVISFYDGGTLRKLKVNESLLDIDKQTIPAVIEDMARYGRMASNMPAAATGPLTTMLSTGGTTTKANATFGRKII